MPRILLLPVLFSLVLGCSRKVGKTDGDSSAAEVPKLEPTTRFTAWKPAIHCGSIAFSVDGTRLALGRHTQKDTRHTQIWNVAGEPKLLAEFDGGDKCVLSPSGKRVLVITSDLSRDAISPVYDVDTKQRIGGLTAAMPDTFFRDENTLVLSRRESQYPTPRKARIIVWDVAKNAESDSFEIDDGFSAARSARGGKEVWLFRGRDRLEIERIDLAAKRPTRTIHLERPEGVRPNQGFDVQVLLASDDSVAMLRIDFKDIVFDTETGKPLWKVAEETGWYSRCFVPGAPHLLLVNKQPRGQPVPMILGRFLVDWKQNLAVAELAGERGDLNGSPASISGDGKRAVVVNGKAEVRIFDISAVK